MFAPSAAPAQDTSNLPAGSADSEFLGIVFSTSTTLFRSKPAGRAELKRILDESGLWDGRAWALHVSSTTDRTIEPRADERAGSADRLGIALCLGRERFVAFLQEQYPHCLPHARFAEAREEHQVDSEFSCIPVEKRDSQ